MMNVNFSRVDSMPSNALMEMFESENPQVAFWKNQRGWIDDCETHIFLAKIVLLHGRHLNGDNWQDSDPFQEKTRPLSSELNVDTPIEDIRRAARVLNKSLKTETLLSESPYWVRPGPLDIPTKEQWPAASELIDAKVKRADEAMRRHFRTIIDLESAFKSGKVLTAYRPAQGGKLTPLEWHDWYGENVWRRFETCSFDPAQPFARSVGAQPAKILVERHSYEKFCSGETSAMCGDGISNSLEVAKAFQRPRGRPTQVEWDRIFAEAVKRIHLLGVPSSVRDFARELADWAQMNLERCPEENYVREKLTIWLAPLLAEISH